MVTRKMEYNFEEIKCYFNPKILDQEEKLMKVSNNVWNERVCPRIYRERTKTKKSSDDVLDIVKSLFKEAKVDVVGSVIDSAQRIGTRYLDASSNNYCKSIIIRFTTLRHRIFYVAKNRSKKGLRTKFDLSKSKYDLLNRANDHVKEVPFIEFCYGDKNCCLKVNFNVENQKDIFCCSFHDFWDIVDMFVNLPVSLFPVLFFVTWPVAKFL